MPRLDDIQRDVSRAILIGDTSRTASAIVEDGMASARRLQVYRNHYSITLREALAATYPAVARLVGEACFNMLAREFITLSPPKSPCLFEYGDGFPLYLAAVAILDPYPYLPDVARLEWALNVARHAPDTRALASEDFAHLQPAQYSDMVFSFHPACRFVASRFPIDRIWRANMTDNDAIAPIDLGSGKVELLIQRDAEDDAGWRLLDPAESYFIRRLRAARPLSEAWTAAVQCDAAFDGIRTLAGLIDSGALIDFHLDPTSKERVLS